MKPLREDSRTWTGVFQVGSAITFHREDQINESDHIITQRDTIIEFLQAQIHDLIINRYFPLHP
jgi:hypothetical protein